MKLGSDTEYVVNADEMKKIDCTTIEDIGVPSVVLMERAALCVAEEVMSLCRENTDIRIAAVCGTGNNGADAVAAARILYLKGYNVDVVIPNIQASKTEEMDMQFRIVKNLGLNIISSFEADEYNIIIDGLFGIGLKRDIEGVYLEITEKINNRNKTRTKVVSVDIPSGINAGNGMVMGAAVRADKTVTFGVVKAGLLLYPGAEYASEIIVADIGFPGKVIEAVNPRVYTLRSSKSLFPKRTNNSNKGTYGRVLVAAGSENMTGAAYLSSKAAYRTGAGLVEVLTKTETASIVRNKLPEAICTIWEDAGAISKTIIKKANVIAAGPGIGTEPDAAGMLEALISACESTLILDADALNILSARLDSKGISGIRERIDELNKMLPEHTILTPHVKELSRLLGIPLAELKAGLFDIAYEMTYNNKLIFVCKDAKTIVAYENNRYINQSGNNGMSTGGSGDVLTGMIAGLAAGGFSPEEAAVKGVYLHGLCGDMAAAELGQHSMMAEDIIDRIARYCAENKIDIQMRCGGIV